MMMMMVVVVVVMMVRIMMKMKMMKIIMIMVLMRRMRRSLHSRNAFQDFTGATSYRYLQENAAAQDRRSNFARACMNRMSRFHKSHSIQKFTGKMPQPKTATQTLCEPAQSKHMKIYFTRPTVILKFTGKCRSRE